MSSQMGERERGTFPSQPEINPRDTRANSSSHAQINAIHTYFHTSYRHRQGIINEDVVRLVKVKLQEEKKIQKEEWKR